MPPPTGFSLSCHDRRLTIDHGFRADGARHLIDPIIDGWVQVDQPDNAQSLPSRAYGDCILPSAIISKYQSLKAADPKRPVKAALGPVAGQPGYDPRADVIREGTVDGADLAIAEGAARRRR